MIAPTIMISGTRVRQMADGGIVTIIPGPMATENTGRGTAMRYPGASSRKISTALMWLRVFFRLPAINPHTVGMVRKQSSLFLDLLHLALHFG